MGRTVKFEQSPPRWACQPISNEGAAVPPLAQYVNHTQKGGKKVPRKVGKDGKTRWKRRINIQDDRDGTAAPSPAKGKEAGQ